MFREGTALEALETVDSRRFLPHAVAVTLLTIVAPALVVVALSPLSGIADLLLSALLATGLSVAAGSACAALWTRLPQSREIPFGDLMLWAWARRVWAERQLARAVADPDDDNRLGRLRTLAVVFEAREGSSHGHSGRVARHAERIARRLGLPAEEVERIEAAAAVHDVGLLGVPAAVLVKAEADRGPDERALVRRHVVDGAERVAAVAGPETAALVRHHHERVDGTGYPDGLAGDEIPLGARIIAVADRFDELISSPPGRAPTGRRNVLDELSARAGSELDAEVVAAFAAYYSGVRSIAGVAFVTTAPQRAVRWIAAAPATIGSAVGAPVTLQSMCAAGATVVAGACLAGVPALTPERDAGKIPRLTAATANPTSDAALPVAAAPDPTAPRARGDGGRERAGGRAPGAPGDGGSPGGSPPPATGGGTPVAPPSEGGGGGGPPKGGGGGGGTPQAPSTTVPGTDADLPPVEAPPPPANPVSQVVDPVLDGVSNAVPPAKPVTDAVKGVVGGLTGGLLGGGRSGR